MRNRHQTRSSKDQKQFKRDNAAARGTRKGNRKDKPQRQAAEIADTAMEMSKSNPYAWYANFPNYADDVAKLAFGVPVGQAVYVQGNDWVASDGIMGLYFTPSIGISKDNTSAVNRQATRIFTYLRSIQRSAANYDSADLMMYLLGIDSLYMYWAMLRRIYGVAQLFTPTNKYYPKRILNAMYVDPSIINNLADFRAYINRFALNVGRFAMPKDFDITARHMWMCEGLYLDSNTRRAQTYLFMPMYFYQWDNTVTEGSKLSGQLFVDYVGLTGGSGTPWTFEKLVEFGEKLLDNFNNDDDTMRISGDLYRAYEGNLMAVEETPANYAIAPVYDETVLSQIENITIGGFFRAGASNTSAVPEITQDPSVNNGAIIFNPYLSFGGNLNIGDITSPLYARNYAAYTQNAVLNSHKDAPTSEDVMEMTRLQTRMAPTSAPWTSVVNVGTEVGIANADIVNFVALIVPARGNTAGYSILNTLTNTIWCKSDGTPYEANAASLLAHFMQFDWAPLLYIVLYSGGSSADLQSIGADLDNFTVASYDQLKNISDAAMLSLLDSPAPVKA